MLQIVIVPNTRTTPAGKLADAEVHFTAGLLAGTKLIGFSIWESQWPDRRSGAFVRVTCPSREYAGADGQTKRYDLLRPVVDERGSPALDGLRAAILDAFQGDQGQVDQATAIARQTWREAQQPAPRPAAAPAPRPAPPRQATPMHHPNPRRQAAAGGRPVPPPHTDDDYPF